MGATTNASLSGARRVLWAFIGLLVAVASLAVSTAEPASAGTNTPRGYDWPSGWKDPTGGAANRWRDWGFNTCGPANGNYGLTDSSWYFDKTAHLGVDSSGAGSTTTIRPIAAGTIAWAGQPWGAEWGGVIVVEHKASNGDRFAAVYAHIEPSTMKKSGTVSTSTSLGRIKANQPYGDHLHFGIVPLRAGEQAKDIAKRGSTSCAYGQDGPTHGYVNPIPYLAARRPAGTSSGSFDPCAYNGKVVGATGTNAKYLVRKVGNTCKRFHIPSGGDYQSIVNNIGSRNVVIFSSVAKMNRIPNAGQQARTARVDEPRITGPTRWLHRVTGLGSRAFGGDMTWTTSAAGKSYVTNEGQWNIRVASDGVYRIRCFIPNRNEALAHVRYRVYDGGSYEFARNVNQRNHIGWVTLGDRHITNGMVKIRLRDNEGSGPYNTKFAFDACEAVPIR